MNPFDFWQSLVRDMPPSGADLTAAIRNLRGLPLGERAAYLGFVLDHADNPDAEIRKAALTALGGARGYEPLRHLVAALDDEDPETRQIAVESLRQSAAAVDATASTLDPNDARWTHALFHENASIRQRAVDPSLPQAGPRWRRNLLASDPEGDISRFVSESCDLGEVYSHEIHAILRQQDLGQISDALARRRLALAKAPAWLQATQEHYDVWRSVLPLFLQITDAETKLHSPNVSRRFFSNFAGIGTTYDETTRSGMLEMLRSVPAEEWPEEWLHAAAVWAPTILLNALDPTFPLERRRNAARVLPYFFPTAKSGYVDPVWLPHFLRADLVRFEDGSLDLFTLGCIIHLFDQDPGKAISELGMVEEIRRAFSARPQESGPLFRKASQCGGLLFNVLTNYATEWPENDADKWEPTLHNAWGFSLPLKPEADFESVLREAAAEEWDLFNRVTLALDDEASCSDLESLLRTTLRVGPVLDDCGVRRKAVQRLTSLLGADGLQVAYPCILSEELDSSLGNSLRPNQFNDLPMRLVKSIVRGVLAAGIVPARDELHLIDWLRVLPLHEPVTQEAYALILSEGISPGARREAKGYLERHASRRRAESRLVQTFAWGVRLGKQLTGKKFRIEMLVSDQLGYTRLRDDVLYITAMPILRGEPNGESIVRGLIVHEYGHHLYHKSPEAMAIWAQADGERLGRLLNLVADEHLERNLRQKNESFGQYLKLLNAYAFQRRQREIPFESLTQSLGPLARQVLVETPLKVARRPDSVVVQNGKLLALLDTSGNSFARFMRALRMGLGNRMGDPKVEAALRLFRGNFRRADMARLYEITKELAAIFGDDVSLLQNFDMDRSLTWTEDETIQAHEDVFSDEVQRQVEQALSASESGRDGRVISRHGGHGMNLGENLEFPRIDEVVKLHHNPAAHAAIADPLKREAAILRSALRQLGIGTRPQRRRTQGRRFDRARTQDLVLKGDPRVLWSREQFRFTDLFLGVAVDCSGSMYGEKMDKARVFATLLAEAVRGMKEVDLRLFGFTHRTIFDAGDARTCAAHDLVALDGNNDAGALWHVYSHALRSKRSAKLLVMISDGLPSDCTVASLRALVARLTRRGCCCAQVAVAPISEICFPHYVLLGDDELSASVRKFAAVTSKLVQKALGGA
jgi:hypothetical protein